MPSTSSPRILDLPRRNHDEARDAAAPSRWLNSRHGLIAEALAMRGLGETSLIADWPAIVGETLARHARPIELQWPPRAAKRDPDAPLAPATLVLQGRKRFRARGAAQRLGDRGSGERPSRLAVRRQDRLPARPAASAQGKAPRRAAPLRRRGSRCARRGARRSTTTGCATRSTRLGARAIDRSARLRMRPRAPERPKGD